MISSVLLGMSVAEAKKYVYVMPHSHDDVGWLKTVNQYFDGSRKSTQYTYVDVELSTIIDALLLNPERRFSEVEMKFFNLWWVKQTDAKKDQVRQLVKSGQLEIINAGWSMHDEACPIYEDMIDNMMKGQLFALKEFGVKPRIGWQIDPFGHSNTNARLFHEMGFEAMFFGRMDTGEAEDRRTNKERQWIQKPTKNAYGKDQEVFFHYLNNIYVFPNDFNWDLEGNDAPFEDDPKLETFDAEAKYHELDAFLIDLAYDYPTDHMFVCFGMDFQYMDAFKNYENMDRMIAYINAHHSDDYEFKYTTPSMYIDAINKLNHTWTVKHDDLFPYQDQPSSYWTGYFSSRAGAKG